MATSRRTALLLSVLASAAFWLLMDTLSRVERAPSPLRGEGLAPVPLPGVALLMGGVALTIYVLARFLHAIGRTSRKRRTRWPLAMGAVGLLACGAVVHGADRVAANSDAQWDLHGQFERVKHERGVWREACGDPYSALFQTALVIDGDIVRRHERWRRWTLWVPVYAAFGVWDRTDVTVGTLRDGIITWQETGPYTSRQRLERTGSRLTLTYVR